MTTAPSSSPAPEPLRFSITGPIATWDPLGLWLRFGERNLLVAAGVSLAGLAPGARVTASGYQERGTDRWIVTQLTLH